MTSARVFLFLSSLALLLALPLHATPAPHPDAAFLAQLSGQGICPAQLTAGLTSLPQVIPPPQLRVIYPDCGSCSLDGCWGSRSGDFCVTSTGASGTCVPQNIQCEPQTSKCTCR